MTRRRPQANRNAEILVSWLESRFLERSTYGYPIEMIASELDWSETKTRATIDWCRNRMSGSRFRIVCFRNGHTWYYKIPTTSEARGYELFRGRDVAVRSSNILLGVRKEAAEHGVTAETNTSTQAYTEVLRWLSVSGVEDAEALLEQALRPVYVE